MAGRFEGGLDKAQQPFNEYIAKVLIQALRSAQAACKTFEVHSAQARRIRREPAFDELVHDTQDFHSIEEP